MPVLASLPSFVLQSQEGKAFGSRDLKGRVWAAAFMFTRCPSICPRVTRFMRTVQLAAKAERVDLMLVSFSVDPDNDTPSVLKEYAARFEADLSTWTFLTGDLEGIKTISVDGFKLALDGRADPAAKDFGIIHGSHLVLVDGEARIRGYYRTEDEAESKRLLADARRVTG